MEVRVLTDKELQDIRATVDAGIDAGLYMEHTANLLATIDALRAELAALKAGEVGK